MVNLFVLFCSLIIQLGAVSIPYELVPDDNTLLLIQEIRQACLNSEDAGCLFFADSVQDFGYSSMPYYIELGSNGSTNYRVCFPTSYQNTSLTSSCTATWYMVSNGVILCNIRWVNYTVFWYDTQSHTLSSSQNRESSTAEVVVPWRDGEGRTKLITLNGDIRDENGNIIIYNEGFINDVPSGDNFAPLGSLSLTGHSSSGSPIDELNNNGVNWSSTQGSFTLTGHSIGNVTTPPSPDPNSNLELILSGFLGGILNNTNDILGNTFQLGSVLGGVSNNIIQGASAIFNAISNINNILMGFINYIKEPLDEDRISAKLEEVPLYQTFNSLVGFSDSFLSSINSVQDPDHLYLTMDFRNANEPFRRLGLYVFDFTFLDNLKSTWQSILLAVLYVTLGVNIFYDLPNIVHGISGLSGGDE